MSSSSGIASLSERSIVGIGRVQDTESSNKIFALMDDGSDYIVQYPSLLTKLYSKNSGATGDGGATRLGALTIDPQGSR